MVDVYLELAKTYAISAFDHSNTKFIDVGKPESILKAEQLFKWDWYFLQKLNYFLSKSSFFETIFTLSFGFKVLETTS